MANTQGMCKNCGSLIMFDNRDEMCECVFCNCVFPAKEAVELLSNPEGHEFANEKFERTGDSHHYTTRTYSTESLEKSIAREEIHKQNTETTATNEFEVTAKDVKAPKKVVVMTIGISLAAVILVLAVSVPLYLSRTKLHDRIDAGIIDVISSVVEDDASVDYSISGQACKSFKLVTDATINEAEATELFEAYCALRSDDAQANGVVVTIYHQGGIWNIRNGAAPVEVIDATEDDIDSAETASDS